LKDALVILPLGVVQGGGHKNRLILDARFTNFWTKYRSFRYEQLSSCQNLIQPNDYMWAWDQKSGYHYVPLNPSAWRFFAFSWQGRTLVYVTLTFGDSCRLYTLMGQFTFVSQSGEGSSLIDRRTVGLCAGQRAMPLIQWLQVLPAPESGTWQCICASRGAPAQRAQPSRGAACAALQRRRRRLQPLSRLA